ncbi:MAG: general secretion pathway protein GspB [Burkholderiaceae bacterium]|nr:general secretion pathway protein GspB [Burkholderiaceae bacterium]
MSYILDALKKAESERQLGVVPNIYAAAPQDTSDGAARGRRKWLPWLLVLNALVVAAICVWIYARQTATEPVATPPLPIPVASVAAPVVHSTPAPQPAVALPALRGEATPDAHPPGAQSLPEPKAAAAPREIASEEAPIGGLHDLPENIQREIPAVTVNGYIYAKNPADRSALINNKLLHEGEQVEPGLTVEALAPRAAVLSYKGYRFRLPY